MLRLEGVSAGYGAVTVLRGLAFAAGAGQVTCVMGRNGVGKTTMLRAIMGLIPVSGSVTLAGQELSGLPAHEVPRRGIALVPQGRRLFGPLTVAENLEIGLMTRAKGRATREAVLDLCPRLAERLDQPSATLSGGEQQMLAIGRALMTNPKLLVLDEATEGLAPVIRAEIWACLARLKQDGQSILVIDKNVDALVKLADRHLILEKGRIVWEGTSGDFLASPDLKDRYLHV